MASYQLQLKWHVNAANGGFGRAIYVGVFLCSSVLDQKVRARESESESREGHRCPCSVW